jgi:preprotein translocase subunit SecG
VLYYILLFLLILNGLFLGVVVLLQSGKGGGLASMGGGMGTDTLIGGRQAATLLTKATWTAGGTFMTLALLLSIVSSRQQAPESILRDTFTPQTTAPAPVLPGSTGAAGGTQQAAPQQNKPQTTPPATTNR